MDATLLRRLAELDPAEAPVLSIYLNMSPQETGQNPAKRSGQIVLKDRLHDIEKSYLPRGDNLDSVRADIEKINTFFANDFAPSAQGVAIFACSMLDLFETAEMRYPFADQVTVGATPDLFQLAAAIDYYEPALVVLLDGTHLRLFAHSPDGLSEIQPEKTRERPTFEQPTGMADEPGYERDMEKHRRQFIAMAAADITAAVAALAATRMVIAAEDENLTMLKAELRPDLLDKVVATVRMDIRSGLKDIENEVTPILQEAERANDAAEADRLLEYDAAGALAVTGMKPTLDALLNGNASKVLIDPSTVSDQAARADVVRRAALVGAGVQMVAEHEAFQRAGGVGAFLRYSLRH